MKELNTPRPPHRNNDSIPRAHTLPNKLNQIVFPAGRYLSCGSLPDAVDMHNPLVVAVPHPTP